MADNAPCRTFRRIQAPAASIQSARRTFVLVGTVHHGHPWAKQTARRVRGIGPCTSEHPEVGGLPTTTHQWLWYAPPRCDQREFPSPEHNYFDSGSLPTHPPDHALAASRASIQDCTQ